MKKYISIILVSTILSLSLCGCTEDTTDAPKAEKEQTTETATLTDPNKEIIRDEDGHVYFYPEGLEPTEPPTEPLTEEDKVIVQVVKDYFTAIETLDLDTFAKLYNPDITSPTPVHEFLKETHKKACDSGISPDDSEAIWEFSKDYDGLQFTFADYVTCEIDGDTAYVVIEYLVRGYENYVENKYHVRFNFDMINVDGKWYLNDDHKIEDMRMVYSEKDTEYSILTDSGIWSTENIDSTLKKCYKDIQKNNIKKYNVESAKLITVADAVKLYGDTESFDAIGNEKYGYKPYWNKTEGCSVFINASDFDLVNCITVSNYDNYIPLSEDNKPSSSVYVVDLFE